MQPHRTSLFCRKRKLQNATIIFIHFDPAISCANIGSGPCVCLVTWGAPDKRPRAESVSQFYMLPTYLSVACNRVVCDHFIFYPFGDTLGYPISDRNFLFLIFFRVRVVRASARANGDKKNNRPWIPKPFPPHTSGTRNTCVECRLDAT